VSTWKELADQINQQPGHQLITISFIQELKHLMSYQQYQRSEILSVGLHEGLFTIRIGWSAVFCPLRNQWLWFQEPSPSGQPVNAIDGDTLGSEPVQIEEGLVRITFTRWKGILIIDDINPASAYEDAKEPEVIRTGNPTSNHIEGGMWIASPKYHNLLVPSHVRDP
jgi:hypothetical protein